MDRKQLESLYRHEEEINMMIRLQASDFNKDAARDPKTLLYGYDCDRNTWHVFQDFAGFIYLYVYKANHLEPETAIRKLDLMEDGVTDLQDLVPNKRLYPQYCDYDFCVYLKERRVHLPFTTYGDPQVDTHSCFHGEIF